MREGTWETEKEWEWTRKREEEREDRTGENDEECGVWCEWSVRQCMCFSELCVCVHVSCVCVFMWCVCVLVCLHHEVDRIFDKLADFQPAELLVSAIRDPHPTKCTESICTEVSGCHPQENRTRG